MMLAKFAYITRAHKARVGPFVTRSIIPIRSLRLILTPAFNIQLTSLKPGKKERLLFLLSPLPLVKVQNKEAGIRMKSVKGISSSGGSLMANSAVFLTNPRAARSEQSYLRQHLDGVIR
jgi:hypothetical protein